VLPEVWRAPEAYAGATATLQLFKAPSELPSELQEGIIVCDDHAVHQVTRFAPDLEQDPIARRFYGRLDCPYIRTLQLEFEESRKKGMTPSPHNPVDIVDPNRRRGLDRENHPFVRELFAWAGEQLRIAVDQVKRQEAKERRDFVNEDTRKRLRELGKAVARHLQERIEEEMLLPRTSEDEATLAREGVLLNPQFSKIAVGEVRRLAYTVLSFGESDARNVTVETDGPGLKVSPAKPALKPQKRNPERLTAYFDIQGVHLTEKVVLTVRNVHELIGPVSRDIRVVEAQDEYLDYPEGISFEKQNYTVHDNGSRTLCFVAKGSRYREVDWRDKGLVHSSNPQAVPILRGSAVDIENRRKDLWRGQIQVRGRGVGRQSTVTLRVSTRARTETASASVEVVDKAETPDVAIEIKIVSDPPGQWRAEWDRETPNLLKIYGTHPVLARYRGQEEDGYPGEKDPQFKVLVAEIVAQKVTERVIQQKIVSNPRLFEEPNAFFFLFTEEMNAFLPTAHRVMVPG
jgi:hypothetical protein